MSKKLSITFPLMLLAVAAMTPAFAKDPSVQVGDGPDGFLRDGKPVTRGWTRLFDGKTLKGWMGEKGYWEIKDGAIVGTQPPNAPLHHYLFSTKDYSDFELHIDVKLVGYNSGVCIRIAPETYDSVPGYQVDMGDGYWGCLWEEHKRQTKVFTYPKEDADKILHKDDWNHYFVRAAGHHITIYLNGTKTVDGVDPLGLLSGPLGFQLCHGGPEVASFRNIYIKTYKPPTKGTAPLPPIPAEGSSSTVSPASAALTPPPAAPNFDHKTSALENTGVERDAIFRAGDDSPVRPLLTLGLNTACDSSTRMASEGAWKSYRSNAGRFTARFPGNPLVLVSARTPDPKGVAVTTEIGYPGVTGVDGYIVTCINLPATPSSKDRREMLWGLAAGIKMRMGAGYRLISDMSTTFCGQPARELKAQTVNAGHTAFIVAMTAFVGKRVYVIMTDLPNTADHEVLTRRFQAGFKLLPSS